MTGMTQRWRWLGVLERVQALSWKACLRILWNSKEWFALVGGCAWVMLPPASPTIDPGVSSLTATQLASVLLAQARPVVFGIGVCSGLLWCTFMMADWARMRRGLGLVILTTLAFWGGVYATTYAYTAVISEASTFILSQPTAQGRIPQ